MNFEISGYPTKPKLPKTLSGKKLNREQTTHLSNPHAVVQRLLLPEVGRGSDSEPVAVRAGDEVGELVVGDGLVLEVLRRRQLVLRRVELRTRLAADPDQDGVPGVVLPLRLGIARDLVAEIDKFQ